MKTWNDDWRNELKTDYSEVYDRFCYAKSTRKDLKLIAKLMYKYNPNITKEETLDRTIHWITDLNNQVNLIPDEDEYHKIIESM